MPHVGGFPTSNPELGRCHTSGRQYPDHADNRTNAVAVIYSDKSGQNEIKEIAPGGRTGDRFGSAQFRKA